MKDQLSEENDSKSLKELNTSPSEKDENNFEGNNIEIVNRYDGRQTEKIFEKKETKKKSNIMKLVSGFVAVCATVAMVQTTFKIPILSDLFHPTAIVTPTPMPPSYAFYGVSTTGNSISYSLQVDNVDDFSSNDYKIVVVTKGNDNDTFIQSMPTTIINANATIVTGKITSGKFVQYIGAKSTAILAENSDYVIMLLYQDSIVQKQDVKTKNIHFVTGLKTSINSGYMMVNLDFRGDVDYEYLYMQFIDVKTGIQLSYSNVSKGSNANVSLSEIGGYDLKIKIYCLPNDPTGFTELEKITFMDQNYYLIYTYTE